MKIVLPGTRRKRSQLIGLIFAATLVSVVLAPCGLVIRTERRRSDAIVILAGSSTYLERAHWAAKLWSEGRAPAILLTNDGQSAGWDDARQRNPSFAERAADELQRNGVSLQAIRIIPELVTGTYDEAGVVREYAAAHDLHSLQFVTSPYHTRRVHWTLEHVFAGSNIELGVDAPPAGEQSPRPLLWWTGSLGWKSVALEYVKFVYYRLRY